MSSRVQVQSHRTIEMITYNFANWTWGKSYESSHISFVWQF